MTNEHKPMDRNTGWIKDWLHNKMTEMDCDLKKSAFQFENGVRIVVYTGLWGDGEQIKSFICNENWEESNTPFAECPLSWSGKTATEYHKFLRTELHSKNHFVAEYSTKLKP